MREAAELVANRRKAITGAKAASCGGDSMTRRRSSVASPVAPSALLGDIRALIEAARKHAASTVNSELTMLYWRIGQRIHTQVLDGRRGAYGKVLPTLAAQLVKSTAAALPSRTCAVWCSSRPPSPTSRFSYH